MIRIFCSKICIFEAFKELTTTVITSATKVIVTEISSLKINFTMDIQDKTKEEFQKELLELRQEYNSLKELYDKENSMRKYAYDEMLETNLKLTLAMKGGNMAWWEMDVPTGHVTFDKHKV